MTQVVLNDLVGHWLKIELQKFSDVMGEFLTTNLSTSKTDLSPTSNASGSRKYHGGGKKEMVDSASTFFGQEAHP